MLLSCSDGLWTGINDSDIASLTADGDGLSDKLKALSMKALRVNAPNSDNTTGTALKWLGA